ncbi:MAG: hypothetical protein OEM98_14275 [Gammaproteobacteria bacterium]|nr:hypothetical protein [Gammaproteobacteria bacterium]
MTRWKDEANRAMHVAAGIAFSLVVALSAEGGFAAPEVASRYEARSYTDDEGETLPYRLFIPDAYDPQTWYPLVIFLHGSAERGRDNVSQVMYDCVADVLSRSSVQVTYPSFVLAPQASKDTQWGFYIGNPAPADLVVGTIQQLEREFSIDPNRIYLTGSSMGAMGTFYLLGRYPGLFAAAVPIAGGGDPAIARQIIHIPLWAFHGDHDNFVPISGQVREGLAVYGTRNMIEAMRAVGGTPRYTEMKAYGHLISCWVLRKTELFQWLFSQHRARATLAREDRKSRAETGK